LVLAASSLGITEVGISERGVRTVERITFATSDGGVFQLNSSLTFKGGLVAGFGKADRLTSAILGSPLA
jgi:hypothetical protein